MSYKLRALSSQDKELVFDWRNQHFVRESMFSSNVISPEDHCKWFAKALSGDSGFYFIFECYTDPIGFIGCSRIGFQKKKASWTFYLGDKERSPRGAGYMMCELFLDQFFFTLGFEELEAEVIGFNKKSSNLHEKLGFDLKSSAGIYHRGGIVYKVNKYVLDKCNWSGRSI